MSYVEHPLIKPNMLEARLYQQRILAKAVEKNSLVVLPTGTGKTPLAIMLAAHRLSKLPNGKVLVMAPTRPLTVQHYQTFKRTMNLNEFEFLTGHKPPAERERVWREAKIIFATPQVVERDLIVGKVKLEDFSLVVFDEAHRAVGEYPYSFIAEQYMRASKNPLILALTASPGAEKERIDEVKQSLFIEHVEIKSERDHDVKPYVQKVVIEWRTLELPQAFKTVKRLLEEQLREQLLLLKRHGCIASIQNVKKRDLLELQKRIQQEMREFEPKPPEQFYACLIAQTIALKLSHAIELLETQGMGSLERYLSRLIFKSGMPGAKMVDKLLTKDQRTQRILGITRRLEKRFDHPKIGECISVVKQELSRNSDSKILIFTNYRDLADKLVKLLNEVEGVRAAKIIGQASREGDVGLSQRKQVQAIEKFREGEVNVLVSTAVGEEGLNLPDVETVVFYEAVPSEIRAIQRRGRTGRTGPGRVVVLLAKGTRDEAFYWSAVRKEQQMRRALYERREEKVEIRGQKMLDEFEEKRVKIIADHREMASGVARMLVGLGAEVESRQLDVGDFILSDRVGVERKTVRDFLQSIVDKRLLEQAKLLSENFERPVLVLEGNDDLYSLRAIHPNAIRGALVAVAVDFGISVLPTRDEKETAAVLAIIAKREQIELDREVAIRGERKGLSLPEQQRFVVEGLPGVSAVLAQRLLEHFGTVERVMSASEEELQQVHGIGREKARDMRLVLSSKYEAE